MTSMAVTAKKLDVKIGDLVEIEGRKYDVVSDKHGGVALEPAITKTVAEIHAEHGSRPLTPRGVRRVLRRSSLRRRGLARADIAPRPAESRGEDRSRRVAGGGRAA